MEGLLPLVVWSFESNTLSERSGLGARGLYV